MLYGVSEAARLLEQEINTIKDWAFKFSDYLTAKANPGKGKVRQFTINDLRVFAYISMYWEDKPDIENIKCGLNSSEHYDNDVVDNFIKEITPLFITMPDDINETWRGVVFGGEFQLDDLFNTANSFKLAGDRLVEMAYNNQEEKILFQPALYNYRHATELYIKAITRTGKDKHNLISLLGKFKLLLNEKFNAEIPEWFENIIIAFDYVDPNGAALRYGETKPSEELYVDMNHVKELMNWLSQSLKNIYLKSSR